MLGLMLAATLTAANDEIVIPGDATPVVRFAAKEAQEILSQAFETEIPVVSARRWAANRSASPASPTASTAHLNTTTGRTS